MRWPAHFIDAHESRQEKSHFDASFAEPIPFLSKNYVLGGRNVLQGTINQTTKSRRNPPKCDKKIAPFVEVLPFCLWPIERRRRSGTVLYLSEGIWYQNTALNQLGKAAEDFQP